MYVLSCLIVVTHMVDLGSVQCEQEPCPGLTCEVTYCFPMVSENEFLETGKEWSHKMEGVWVHG